MIIGARTFWKLPRSFLITLNLPIDQDGVQARSLAVIL